jgi:hypothetical protein
VVDKPNESGDDDELMMMARAYVERNKCKDARTFPARLDMAIDLLL